MATQGGYRVGAGRKKGSPNKLTANIKAAIQEAFTDLGGVPSLVKWGKKSPDEFYRLWGRLAPHEVSGPEGGPLIVRVRIEREGRRRTAS